MQDIYRNTHPKSCAQYENTRFITEKNNHSQNDSNTDSSGNKYRSLPDAHTESAAQADARADHKTEQHHPEPEQPVSKNTVQHAEHKENSESRRSRAGYSRHGTHSLNNIHKSQHYIHHTHSSPLKHQIDCFHIL